MHVVTNFATNLEGRFIERLVSMAAHLRSDLEERKPRSSPEALRDAWACAFAARDQAAR